MKYRDLPRWKLTAAALALVLFGFFYLGKHYVAAELIDARQHAGALEAELDDARERLSSGQAQIAVLEREVDVLRRANTLLRESERGRQDEIAGLQADLEFYRRLGGASGSQAPLAVHYLEMQPTQSDRVYRLVFTLTQNLRWAAVISGRVEIGLDGIMDGAAVHLTTEQLLPAETHPVEFRFKYFQQVERLLTLPEGFAPGRLTLRLRSAGLRQPVERSSQWQDLFEHAPTDVAAPAGEAADEVKPAHGGD